MIISTQEMAELFGVSRQAIGLWAKSGCPKQGRGRWNLKEVLPWWLDNIYIEKQASTDENLIEARTRYWRSKADREHLAVQQQQGQLMDRDQIYREWAGRAGEYKSGLYYLVNVLPPLLEGREQAEMRSIIDGHVWQMLDRVCRTGRFVPEVEK